MGLTTLLLSCNSDDNSASANNIEPSENIVGKWLLTAFFEDNENVTETCQLEEFYLINSDKSFSYQKSNTIEDLNQDGTVTTTCSEGELFIGTYEITATELIFTFSDGEIEIETYKFEDGNLSIGIDGFNEVYKKI